MVALCTAALYGCAKSSAPKPANAIAAENQYYVKTIRPSSFTYPADSKKVSLKTSDHGFIEFNPNFKSMMMGLDDGVSSIQVVEFIIVSCSLKNNNISATVQRIYKGEIIRYAITSDADTIYMKTLVSYKLRAVNDDGVLDDQIVVQRNVTVARYSRIDPKYTGGP